MAVTKRQGNFNNMRLKFQNIQPRRPIGSAGRKPLPEPSSVKHVFTMLIMHLCRKVVLFEPELKVPIYLAALVCGSLVTDFLPFPKSYFAQKSNFFNQVFVKWGWAWTLTLTGLYMGLTSYIYCCGNWKRVCRHFYRLLIGTVFWLLWTKLFVYIEWSTGACLFDKYTTKVACNKHGYAWVGFDISGHAFLLIYCGLLITEEAKSIRGWERIGELIRNEEFDEESPLKPLSNEEREHLQKNYDIFTPFVRGAFIILTLLSIIWDVMLVATILYFHHMVTKVVGGIIAICMWFFTYRFWFTLSSSPGLPGQGVFKYCDASPIRQRRSSIVGISLPVS